MAEMVTGRLPMGISRRIWESNFSRSRAISARPGGVCVTTPKSGPQRLKPL
jgi:hypothetical protein